MAFELAGEGAKEEVCLEFTRYFNPWLRGTMVLTDKKMFLTHVFSRLSRESLYTACVMLFTIFLFSMAGL